MMNINFYNLILETLTSFRNTKIEFKVGEEFDEVTGDGRECKTLATVEDRKLIKVQTPDPSTGYHTTREVREWTEDGNMILHLEIPAKPDIVCKRFYKKVEPQSETDIVRLEWEIKEYEKKIAS